MKYAICQNRDALRRMKKSHIHRALLKRRDQRKTKTGKEVTK